MQRRPLTAAQALFVRQIAQLQRRAMSARANSKTLEQRAPALVPEFDIEKNVDLYPTQPLTMNTRVWWRCPERNHSWEAYLYMRTQNGKSCPYCSRLRGGVSLAEARPDLAEQFHATKNAERGFPDASCIAPQSNRPVWWQCKDDARHAWEQSPAARYTRVTLCPHCPKPELDAQDSQAKGGTSLLDTRSGPRRSTGRRSVQPKPPIECPDCAHVFPSRAHLRRHQRHLGAGHSAQDALPKHCTVSRDDLLRSDDQLTDNLFQSYEGVLNQQLVHATSPTACDDILRERHFRGTKGALTAYDGFMRDDRAPNSVMFSLRKASELALVPVSRYPKRMKGGDSIRLLALDMKFLLDDDLRMFYVKSTPTQFARGSFQVTVQTHVVFARGDDAERISSLGSTTSTEGIELDKRSNNVLKYSDESGWSFPTKFNFEGSVRPHEVVVMVAGESMAITDEMSISSMSGKKQETSSQKQGVPCVFDSCYVVSTSLPAMKLHYVAAHCDDVQRARPFHCELCSKSFLTKMHLKTHQKTHDPNRPKPERCRECDYATDSKANLQRHAITHQSDRARAFACDRCDFATHRKDVLLSHRKTHDDHREYLLKCDVCEYATDHVASLTRHLKTHALERPRPYQCDSCGYATDRKDNLHAHRLRCAAGLESVGPRPKRRRSEHMHVGEQYGAGMMMP